MSSCFLKYVLSSDTPPKPNMETENQRLKMCFLLKMGIFQPVMLVFSGVIIGESATTQLFPYNH